MELAADYVRYAKAYYGTAPGSEYFRALRIVRPLTEMYGRTAAVDFGPLQLKAIRERLVGENLSRTYINEFMRRTVALFKWAVADGRIPAAFPQALAMVPGLRRGKTQARETAPVQPIDGATVDATLPLMSPVVADTRRRRSAVPGATATRTSSPRRCCRAMPWGPSVSGNEESRNLLRGYGFLSRADRI